MTAVALVSVINHYHINGLHLSWDTLYLTKGERYGVLNTVTIIITRIKIFIRVDKYIITNQSIYLFISYANLGISTFYYLLTSTELLVA